MRLCRFPPSSHRSLFKSKSFTSSTSTAAPDLIYSLSRCSNLKHINQIHGFMIHQGLHRDNLLLSRFVDVCMALGFLGYAFSVFGSNPDPNIYLYNTMIKALSQADSAKDPIGLFNRIQVVGLRPDSYSFPFVLKAVIRLSTVETGKQIHCQSLVIGLDSNVNVVTALIQMYSFYGCVPDARKLFDGVSSRDVVFWNAMVAGYAKVGDMESARELFERMPERNVISWTTVIAGYTQINRPDEAITVFQRMQLDGVEPDEIAMSAALSACADLGALEMGEWIHNYIDKRGLNKVVPLKNALIDMYAKSGKIGKAIKVFESMKSRSVISWTTIIAGLALHGLARKSLEIFSRMEMAKVKPNVVTFIAVLSACSHVGLVEMGLWFFSSMKPKYGIEPKIEHYGCMVDLLGRAGYLQEAQELVKRMPFEANAAIWGSLLAASNVHGDADLGATALRHLIKLEPNHSGNYTLLSNIYAAVGRWNDSRMVRKMMRDTGVQKMPGGCFIEVNNIVHEFVAGDTLHPEFDRIHEVLCMVTEQLECCLLFEKRGIRLDEIDEG
ncbi:pentatricopeptide repeat-containing protein [Tripterygium wilfordii]|uniref:Pentatricopeptide repeat-containing protein n=1 Tax=Tripterygium wilfordii TaxID=458696 RepID=A0A7J7CNL2_TRIWF|nr:pentatricopeptide repeat-containing protein At5g56310 [Tripterygium wilfordii]KAF5735677.1 pentatricopeptide repeat-containing protein [Tripterygium wilfordii]